MKISNSTPVINNNINNTKQNVSFGSKFAPIKCTKKFLQDTFVQGRAGNLTRPLFITTAFTFLLGSRLGTSRDQNEVRETLTRDVPTFVIAVLGVPVIGKFIANWMQKKYGFAIFEEAKARDPVSNNQLKDWYQYDKNLDKGKGIQGFVQRLSDVGANLKKVCSTLSDDVKAQIAGFSDDNAEFIKKLSKDKSLQNVLETEFGKKGNNALKKAEFLKVVPKIGGFLLTLTTIGIFIPELNIFLTEAINKKKAKGKNENEVKNA